MAKSKTPKAHNDFIGSGDDYYATVIRRANDFEAPRKSIFKRTTQTGARGRADSLMLVSKEMMRKLAKAPHNPFLANLVNLTGLNPRSFLQSLRVRDNAGAGFLKEPRQTNMEKGIKCVVVANRPSRSDRRHLPTALPKDRDLKITT